MAGQFGIAWVCGEPLRYSALPLVLRHPKGSFERRKMAELLADWDTNYEAIIRHCQRVGEKVGRRYAERFNELFWAEFNKQREPSLFANPDEARR